MRLSRQYIVMLRIDFYATINNSVIDQQIQDQFSLKIVSVINFVSSVSLFYYYHHQSIDTTSRQRRFVFSSEHVVLIVDVSRMRSNI